MTTGGSNDRDDPGLKLEAAPELKLPTIPPLIFGFPVIVGALVHMFVWQGDILDGIPGTVLGIALIVGGLAIIAWTWRVMRAHGEHPEPTAATKTLVTNGPFKRSRNPIYVGFLLIGAGMAISLNSLAMLVAVFLGGAALTVLVIRREEEYLKRKFGKVYVEYTRKTRRWV